LHRIASERISPTPEAYSRIYAQIAATHPDHPGDVALPGAAPNHTLDGKASAALIARLLTQLDVHHAGITITRKREGLKRALVPRLEPLDALFARLNRLMDSWNGPNAEPGDHVSQFLGTDIMGSGGGADPAPHHEVSQVFTAPSQLFAATEPMQAPRDTKQPGPAARPTAASGELSERVISFRLAGLLALLLKNIDELTPESALLGNQIEQIGRVLTAPLTEKKLDECERCLRALIVRQGAIKHSIDETKRAVRDLAESLLERLASLVNSTDSYAIRVVDMAEQIAGTDDLGKLSTLTQTLVKDTRLMSSSVAAERELLLETQERVRALEQQTHALETELREASTLVRTDPLTRAMNRRGFADAFRAEMVRSEGTALPSIALIDVDNFKRINEEHGHSIGDQVLCEVVQVLHRCAAPNNVVARHGGEEFALMFPGKSIDETELALVKMQSALTDHLGSESSHLPRVTFSAGVAQVQHDESLAEVITRADKALRNAKSAGKNCVVVATRLAETSLG
jgi:diguanylate cyclase